MSLGGKVLGVPIQYLISRDDVSVRVNAVHWFRAMDAERATIQLEKVIQEKSELAQITPRSVGGMRELDKLLPRRDTLNREIPELLGAQTDLWGIAAVQARRNPMGPENMPQKYQSVDTSGGVSC